MAVLSLQNITKSYANGFEAVKDFNLEVEDGEFIVFVGPSGCGKSTTLRMIAGLEEISSGEFYIDGKCVNDVAPKNRDIAMVFQSYALYPHMSVYDNMAFGLNLKKEKKEVIDEKVTTAAKMLGLTELLKRKPKELSGGQRQRVALGRAVVRNPKIFLMDEPLSNLDAKLRGNMRSEIIKLHKKSGAITIYVTHDQIEAMTMADRIVVMKDGVIQQIDTPKRLYDFPENIFVAGFIGMPAMNFVECIYENGAIKINNHLITLSDERKILLDKKGYEGKTIIAGIRPESIIIAKNNEGIPIVVDFVELLGKEYNLHFTLGDIPFIALVEAKTEVKDDNVSIQFDESKIHLFDKETEQRIY